MRDANLAYYRMGMTMDLEQFYAEHEAFLIKTGQVEVKPTTKSKKEED